MNFHLEHHIAELLYRSIRGKLSDFEREELNQWRSDSPMHEALFMRLQDDGYIDEELGIFIKGEEKNSVLWERIRENSILRKRKRFIRFSRWGAAAVLLLVICVSLFIKKGEQEVVPVAIQTILPGSHKATLLMENGEEIELSDSVRMSIEQGIIASNNQLEYGDLVKELASGYYHVLKIPRGGEYRLKLSDGTIVYLNSDSELRYPVNFSATSREVELRGEAFFEVVTDPQRPFVVNAEQVRVRVLGTSFNVNTYDKDYIETVLVKGRVGLQMEGNTQEWQIKPNELARYDRKNKTMEVKEVDILPYVTWKEGHFLFKNQSLEQIMNIMARWYDVNIFFVGPKVKNLHFSGEIDRYENIEKVLHMIGLTTNISFSINGKTITITPE